ncbi:T9SS type A sorting domain-containing protein [Tenacibaculum sp. ZS6-P6]
MNKEVKSYKNLNTQKSLVNSQGLNSGIYIAKISTTEGDKTIRLIKNKIY